MKLGIVTPLLNAQDYFTACAASVNSNKFADAEYSLTHYVRESSNSKVSCADVASQYGCNYVQDDDSGIYDAIGKGLDAACADGAEVLCWLNADEQVLPSAYSTVTAAFKKYPGSDIIFGDYLLFNPFDLQIISARREIPARLGYLRNGVNYLMSCAVFFRSNVWLEHKKFDDSYKFLADKKFYLSALESGVAVRHIRHYLGAYGVTGHNASLSTQAIAEQKRLREEIGASSLFIRAISKIGRVSEKALRRCYGCKLINTTLYDNNGDPHSCDKVVGSSWKVK